MKFQDTVICAKPFANSNWTGYRMRAYWKNRISCRRIVRRSYSSSHDPVSLVTAITIWRVGNGAIHFWMKGDPKSYATLRDMIYGETIASVTLAQELRGRLKERLGEEIFWNDQVHIDVGERGPTKEFIDAVVGMVKGFGFEAVIKPNAFGASTVA